MVERSGASSPPLRRDLARLFFLAVAAGFVLLPYVWMLAVSAKPQDEVFRATLTLLPERWALVENYAKVLRTVPIGTFLWNGIVVCTAILAFQILFAVPAAYALAKLRFRGREIVFGFVLLGLLIPYQTTALPLYFGFHQLGLLDSYTALVAPFTCSVFAIFLFRQFFRAMPDDLIAAARIDGMGEGSIVWRVVLPNAWPAATAFAIFSVVAHWNDLFWPLIVVQKGDLYTPAMGILAFRSVEAGDDYGALMAAATMVTAPLVAAFLLAQRHFIEGVTMTGLKG